MIDNKSLQDGIKGVGRGYTAHCLWCYRDHNLPGSTLINYLQRFVNIFCAFPVLMITFHQS